MRQGGRIPKKALAHHRITTEEGDDDKKDEKKEDKKEEKKDEKKEGKKPDDVQYEEGFVAKYYFFKEKTDGKGYTTDGVEPGAEAVTTQINFPNGESFKG